MFYTTSFLILPIMLAVFCIASGDYVSENSTNTEERSNRVHILSRRKRFLTFPDGSSLQLVFCVQTSAIIPIGDIFLYGNTAALAWSLPTDPNFFHMLKENKLLRRSDVKKEIYFIDEKGKVLAKKPYKKPRIKTMAFAKRSVNDENMSFKDKLKIKIDRMKMHEQQLERSYLKRDYMNGQSIDFHRDSRVGLYEKIEALLTALGGNGRQCVLRKLCESSRQAPQGTFLQELLRIIFTLPKGQDFYYEEHRDYDKAHGRTEDCATAYPNCDQMEIPQQF